MQAQRAITGVIPTHGRPTLLEQALRSAITQHRSGLARVIVVDDLGDRESHTVVERLAATAPVAIDYVDRSSGTPGVSASRNLGASLATTEYLAFLDDDDLWEPDYFERVQDTLSSTTAPMVVSWMTLDEGTGTQRPLLQIAPRHTAAEVVAHNRGITGSNFVISTAAFAAMGGFDEELSVSNDKDFFLRYLLAGHDYAALAEYLVIHRRHGGPQLTRWDEARARGLDAYARKHAAISTATDRRFLRRQIHSIRRRTSSSPVSRLAHSIAMVANSSPRDLLARVTARPSRERHGNG